jgi:poly(hydroxyalkanoate) depolymerase family esterase
LPSIASTIRQLQSLRGGIATGLNPAGSSRLQQLVSFGTNPGALNGWFYSPAAGEASPPSMPLVVVLHGCTQTAAGYDHGSGWSELAERFGFAVLFPEQQRANNANLCFNWFSNEDVRRDAGEALSIRQMIGAVVARCPIDTRRIFVTGLSAGGAMANVMLATYPELFAGGSIIAGLPYGSAGSVSEALERMRGAGHASSADYADKVRRASSRTGPWPSISVWHGDADHTVKVVNADAIVGQWRTVHGVEGSSERAAIVDGQRHRAWLKQDGEIAVEEYRIAGLGHGTPLAMGGDQRCGNAGAYMLEAGISSTWRQAESWGLLQGPERAIATATNVAKPKPSQVGERVTNATSPMADVNTTIERALRSAGLMR